MVESSPSAVAASISLSMPPAAFRSIGPGGGGGGSGPVVGVGVGLCAKLMRGDTAMPAMLALTSAAILKNLRREYFVDLVTVRSPFKRNWFSIQSSPEERNLNIPQCGLVQPDQTTICRRMFIRF